MPSSAPAAVSGLCLQRAWQRQNQRLALDAVALWLRHGVLSTEIAWQRSSELVAAARLPASGEAGELIGVSTAVVTWCPLLDLPMYFLRVFVAPGHRHPRVARELLAESVRTLSPAQPPVAGDAPRGVWLEIQNPKIDRAIRDLVWRVRGLDFVYIGCSASGQVSRAHYFRGARLPHPQALR